MLSTYMPANLHYFLIDYLGLIRLSSKRIGDFVEGWQRKRGLANYKLILDENSQYSWFLNMAGYKHSFSRNLIIFLFFSVALLLVIACLYMWSFFAQRRTKKTKKALSTHSIKTLEGDEKAKMTGRVIKWHHSEHGAWTLNFSLRFVYEFFLEICICVFIHLAAIGVNANEADFLWVLALIICLLIVLLVIFTVYLFFRGGPYTVPNSYEKNSLWHSWWSVRPLRLEDTNKSVNNSDISKGKLEDEHHEIPGEKQKHKNMPEEEEKV